MSTYAVTDSQLTAIADEIRLKRDTSEEYTVDEMPLAISLIEGGGGGESVAWTQIKNETLTSDLSAIDLTLSGYAELIVIIDGVVNDANNSLANSTSNWRAKINNVDLSNNIGFYIRTAGTFETLIRYTKVCDTVLTEATLFDNGNNIAQNTKAYPCIAVSVAGDTITSFKLSPLTAGHLIKSGAKLRVYGR